MTHPEDLLADYVDGTLTDPERAVVDAHLETCASCREEVELARSAVAAMSALEEVPVPFGVTGPVLAEAGRRTERRRAVAWQRLQWAAGAAAAAALVLVVALNVIPGSSEDGGGLAAGATARTDAGGAGGEAAATLAAPPRLERQPEVNYTDEGVRSLAQGAAEDRSAVEAAPAADLAAPGPALRCLRSSEAPLGEPRDLLVRLVEAEYTNIPAYIAVFRQSPGAGQPPDTVVVWIVATEDCRILNLFSSHL